jgi:hypothetical protein
MRRRVLKNVARRIAEQIEASPQEWRARRDYPVTWEEITPNGKEVQIDVSFMEVRNGKTYLRISAVAGGLSAYCPPGVVIAI